MPAAVKILTLEPVAITKLPRTAVLLLKVLPSLSVNLTTNVPTSSATVSTGTSLLAAVNLVERRPLARLSYILSFSFYILLNCIINDQ
ncbi:hypothetical protein BCR42DRAFT_409154 [Absidia repens]|uniref:Uncharacterized protein n=1 Tax=Absidia repens TaxID=90262 RepID=A0A1X2IQP2_9FUNG|nr:hypothetical protein BCR42DRAFT_409154 [Absidia repens]